MVVLGGNLNFGDKPRAVRATSVSGGSSIYLDYCGATWYTANVA